MALSLLLYSLMFAALGWGFTGASVIGFVIAIAGLVLVLLRDLGGGLGPFMKGTMETATGPISGAAAVALVVTIPVCLATAAVAMGLIFRFLQ